MARNSELILRFFFRMSDDNTRSRCLVSTISDKNKKTYSAIWSLSYRSPERHFTDIWPSFFIVSPRNSRSLQLFPLNLVFTLLLLYKHDNKRLNWFVAWVSHFENTDPVTVSTTHSGNPSQITAVFVSDIRETQSLPWRWVSCHESNFCLPFSCFSWCWYTKL